MSKYDGVQNFVNMKTCIFLILGFIQLVFCSQTTNITGDESYPVCPVSFFRRKRANVDYTRWRSNVETTPEFIVKVLDDDAPTTNTKQVVAVNIQPVTNRGEKIIVGGAVVPPPTPSVLGVEVPREYTRFVPPTTVPVTRIEELYLAPVPRLNDDHPPIRPKGLNKYEPPFLPFNMNEVRHVLRDESPPASPQFLVRSPSPIARQFAPIAAVAFTRRSTHTPLTPPYYERNKNVAQVQPTRSTPPQMGVPFRTAPVPEEFPIFQPFMEEVRHPDDYFVTRTTRKDAPQRTTIDVTDITFRDEDHDLLPTTRIYNVEGRRQEDLDPETTHKDSNIHEKEADLAYHNMFLYNEDYKGTTSKKVEKESVDTYEDKDKEHVENEVIYEKEPGSSETPSPNLISEKGNTTDGDFALVDFADDDQGNYNNDVENSTVSSIDNGITTVENSGDKTTKGQGDKEKEKSRPVCSIVKLRQLNFNSPRTLPEIVAQLKQWAEDSPIARWVDITDSNFTTMENPIHMMIVDDPSSGQIVSAKQTVMVVAGIQGRDHHAVAAAMYLLYQLIERSEAHADLLTKYRFWVIPVFNPDGYDYSMTFPHRREWPKNLRQNWDICKDRESCRTCAAYGLRCTIQPCYGVNLDRNFEYQWIPTEELRAEHPCGALYAGTRQLSEPETRALTHFLHDQHAPLFTFIAFKEGDVLGVMYPYSHTRKRRAFDHVYRQRASRAASAAYSISGRPYVAGQTSEFLPLYAGGIEDWVDGHLGIDNTYTIMMFRPTDSYNSKLITEHVVHEAYAAMDTLLLQSVEPLGPPVVTYVSRSNGHMVLPTVIVIFLGLATIFCS